MGGYTKLFHNIVTSTIWREDDQTRIVWITMLALADKHGEIAASIPGLAHVAGVSVEATEIALNKFMSPDKYSRSPDHEGRRIEKIDGGWAILNHGKYREMMNLEEQKDQHAKRQTRYRDKIQSELRVTQSDGECEKVTKCDDIAKAKAKAVNNILFENGYSEDQLIEIYKCYPKKENRKTALVSILRALKKIKFDDLKEKVKKYAEYTKQNVEYKYIPLPATWFNNERWNDENIDLNKKKAQDAEADALDTIMGIGGE